MTPAKETSRCGVTYQMLPDTAGPRLPVRQNADVFLRWMTDELSGLVAPRKKFVNGFFLRNREVPRGR
jgi:hypothetical protein